jgi:hypothetical protein
MGPLRDACDAIIAVISAHEVVADRVRALLAATGRLPDSSCEPRAGDERLVAGTLATFAAEFRPLLQTALAYALDDTDERFAAIRRFYLTPKPEYSCEELASLWRIDLNSVWDIFHDQMSDGATSLVVSRNEAAETTVTYGLLRPYDVERALGGDFLQVRGVEWKTVPIVLHLPRFVADAFALNVDSVLDFSQAIRIEQFLFEFYSREYARGRRKPEMPR